MLVRGSVPGPDGSCVTIKTTSRPRRAKKAPVVAAAKKGGKPEAKKK
jgi:hypothetical protein